MSATADLHALLAERAATTTDPLVRLLLEQAAAARPSEPDAGEELRALREQNRRLRATARTAAELVRFIATTFGACPECWGLLTECTACRGRGSPGSTEVDVPRLLAWTEPALARAGLTVVPAVDPEPNGRSEA